MQRKATIALLAALALGVAVVAVLGGLGPPQAEQSPTDAADDLPTFEDRAAARAYYDSASQPYVTAVAAGGDGAVDRGRPTAEPQRVEETTSTDRRVGTTNVQVTGVDEPDIVKTDGTHFFYAPDRERRFIEPRPVDERDGGAKPKPERDPGDVHVIDTSDPADPEAVADINATGKLLQVGDSLLVLGDERIRGYDVSNASEPSRAWTRSVNGSLVTARAVEGTVYLVTESPARGSTPCPVRPLGGVQVACTDIHHPRTELSADATYTAIALDPGSGAVTDSVSFAGRTENTVVHVSTDAIYVTYTASEGRAEALVDFLRNGSEVLPQSVRDRIAEIDGYDISRRSKLREMRLALEEWKRSLSPQRREQVEQQLRENYASWAANRQREFTRTGIVRVGMDGTLDVDAVGKVAGEPLNQFSMSQHEGTLRVATTVPSRGSADSANDLYVLDATSLEQVGSVTGMGLTERVYAVRYVGETAYVVTFRRVDPFHVVDLSDPANPEEVGKLKLPGYSSYLHPVDENHVLGVGEEDGQVKAVLFDVSNASNPTIDDTLRLDSHWSAIAESHHAFMQDRRHGVVFLPVGNAGLVVDYTNGTLDVEKRVTTDQEASRARYVGDYLYVFAGDTVEVLDETDWERVTTLKL